VGALLLATRRRASIAESRSRITERWMLYTREGWSKYEHTYDPAQPPKKEDTVVSLVDEGTHPFQVVPFVRMQVPEGLYAMGKLHSLAREHFNKRCASSWAEYKALFAVLYEFMATPTANNFTPQGVAGDPRRATNQVRGQGYSQMRGEKDRAEVHRARRRTVQGSARELRRDHARDAPRDVQRWRCRRTWTRLRCSVRVTARARTAKSIAVILMKVGELMREGVDAVLELVSLVRKKRRTT
jgi:hypothetical protein